MSGFLQGRPTAPVCASQKAIPWMGRVRINLQIKVRNVLLAGRAQPRIMG